MSVVENQKAAQVTINLRGVLSPPGGKQKVLKAQMNGGLNMPPTAVGKEAGSLEGLKLI